MKHALILIFALRLLFPNDAKASFESTETGWVSYADNIYTSGSPFVINAGTTDTLENNGSIVLDSQKPHSVTAWYNSTTKRITPTSNGDWYNVIIRFKAKTSANNDYFTVYCDIGGAIGMVYEETIPMVKGANIEQLYTIKMNVYSASTFIANGGTIKIESNAGILSIYDISYVIARLHRGRA